MLKMQMSRPTIQKIFSPGLVQESFKTPFILGVNDKKKVTTQVQGFPVQSLPAGRQTGFKVRDQPAMNLDNLIRLYFQTSSKMSTNRPGELVLPFMDSSTILRPACRPAGRDMKKSAKRLTVNPWPRPACRMAGRPGFPVPFRRNSWRSIQCDHARNAHQVAPGQA